jgi:starch phosphorylase
VAEEKGRGYSPWDMYRRDHELQGVLNAIRDGFFSPDNPGRFRPIFDMLMQKGDPYMLLADFASYMACQDRVDACYGDAVEWTRKSIRNVAKMGYFSSDRTIREYANDIWNVRPTERQKLSLSPPSP